MINQIRAALVALLLLTLITGIAYPLVVTAITLALFPAHADGSIAYRQGEAVGSTLIGQAFTDPAYFWPRPSATEPFPYNGGASSGSNLAPSSPALLTAVEERVTALRAVDEGNDAPVPVDLVTASGSGLDPHISPAAALHQVPRVARQRGLDETTVTALVEAHTEGRQFGFLGEPRVNVLQLNLALDEATADAR